MRFLIEVKSLLNPKYILMVLLLSPWFLLGGISKVPCKKYPFFKPVVVFKEASLIKNDFHRVYQDPSLIHQLDKSMSIVMTTLKEGSHFLQVSEKEETFKNLSGWLALFKINFYKDLEKDPKIRDVEFCGSSDPYFGSTGFVLSTEFEKAIKPLFIQRVPLG